MDYTDKIRKLMALANDTGATAHEAAAAAAMAAELALKYNIDLDAATRADTTKSTTKEFRKGEYCTSALPRDKQSHMIIAGAVAAMYGCEVLMQIRHNSNKVRFVGQPHNIALCNSWMQYLWKACARANVEYARTRTFAAKTERYKADLGFRLQFASQVSSRLKEKLATMQRGETSSGTALMVVNWYTTERREVQDWMDRQQIGGKLTGVRRKAIDVHATQAGYAAGKRVGLSDQVGANARPLQRSIA
jgi:uncharacterized protein DUF2786